MAKIVKLTHLPEEHKAFVPRRVRRENAVSSGASYPLPADHAPAEEINVYQPPLPSRATRQIARTARVSARGRLVGLNHIIQYESKLEADTAFVLLARPDLEDLVEQPTPVFYRDGGQVHAKRFDFLATLDGGRRVLIEVKPFEKVTSALLSQLDLIAAQMSPTIADEILIVTEQQLPRALVRNARLIHSALRTADVAADDHLRAISKNMSGMVKMRELVSASGLAGCGFRAAVRLIACGYFMTADSSEIDYETRLRRSAEWEAAQ